MFQPLFLSDIVVFSPQSSLINIISYQSFMGTSLAKERQTALASAGKLRVNIRMSPEELQSLQEIVAERSQFKFQKVKKQEGDSIIFCQNFSRIIIQYEPFDYTLSEAFRNQPMPQVEIEKIIFSVCSALSFLHQKKYRHGDIQPKLICCHKGDWRLLDNCFIKGGISAYEKVLEGEEGFISPAQMEKIRHGFVRQSPPIEEKDQIFGLGMTCLELMTGRPSSQCYKQSYIRFNQKFMDETIALAKNTYPEYFFKLITRMIQMNEEQRISIKEIMSQPYISRHSKKVSLKGQIMQ